MLKNSTVEKQNKKHCDLIRRAEGTQWTSLEMHSALIVLSRRKEGTNIPRIVFLYMLAMLCVYVRACIFPYSSNETAVALFLLWPGY